MNELRIFELAQAHNIELTQTKYFPKAHSVGVADECGFPAPVEDQTKFYMYSGPHNLVRMFYVSDILNGLIARLLIVNISDHLDKGTLAFAIVPGDFIYVQGAHVFSPITTVKKGRGQICRGLRRANKVEIRFVFDRWEASSSSAANCWLVGTQNQGSLVQVKDISRDDGMLIIQGTVLGICSNFGDLKKREYAQSWLSWTPKVPGSSAAIL